MERIDYGIVVVALAFGLIVGMIIKIGKYDAYVRELESRVRKLEGCLKGKQSELKKEHDRRLDTEVELEDAQGIIGYQRDKLYQRNHPVQLREYEVTE